MDFLPLLEILFVRSSILIVLIGLILFIAGNRFSANIRQAILTFALVGLLLLPILTLVVPEYSATDLFPGGAFNDSQETTLMYLNSSDPSDVTESGGQHPAAEEPIGGDMSTNPAPITSSPVVEYVSLNEVILIIWSVGIVLLLLWLSVSILRIQHLTQTAKYSMLSNEIPWISDLLENLNIKRSVRIAYSDKVSVPMVWGVFYPTLLLPLSARSWGRARLRTLLLHEFAHIRRWDYLAHLLGKVVTGVYWMNPLVWFAVKKMGEEQEKACDNHVLAVGIPSHEYAQHLLDFMKWLRRQNSHRTVPAMTMGFKTKKVKERMQLLLDEKARRKTVSFASMLLLTILSGCAVLPIAGLNMMNSGIQFNKENSFHFIEVENTEFPEGILTRPDIHASGGQYISVRDGMNSTDSPPGSGKFRYNFNIQNDDTYAIWGRTKTDDGNEDSFWMRMDGGEWIQWNNIRESDMWKWNEVHNSLEDGRPVLYRLSRGNHMLEFAYREENIALDKLLITNNINYRPEGKDPVLPTRKNEMIRIAAASGRIVSHFQILSDERALTGKYLSSPHQKKELDKPPAEAEAIYTFRVSKSGNYQLWARVMAESGSENSFWIRVDDNPWILWNGFEKTGSWNWEQIHDSRADALPIVFELKKGKHTIEVSHRERNANLDEILVTDIPGFYPRAIAAK